MQDGTRTDSFGSLSCPLQIDHLLNATGLLNGIGILFAAAAALLQTFHLPSRVNNTINYAL